MHTRTFNDLVTERCHSWFSATTVFVMVSFFFSRFLPEHKLLLRQTQSQHNISSEDSRKHPELAAAR